MLLCVCVFRSGKEGSVTSETTDASKPYHSSQGKEGDTTAAEPPKPKPPEQQEKVEGGNGDGAHREAKEEKDGGDEKDVNEKNAGDSVDNAVAGDKEKGDVEKKSEDTPAASTDWDKDEQNKQQPQRLSQIEDEDDDIFSLDTTEDNKAEGGSGSGRNVAPGPNNESGETAEHGESTSSQGDGSVGSGAGGAPGEKGLFRRTLGSVGNLASSLGSSFPGSPNMSSIVNFGTGLFGLGEEGEGKEGGEEDKENKKYDNAVRLVDRPDLFKSLDGK